MKWTGKPEVRFFMLQLMATFVVMLPLPFSTVVGAFGLTWLSALAVAIYFVSVVVVGASEVGHRKPQLLVRSAEANVVYALVFLLSAGWLAKELHPDLASAQYCQGETVDGPACASWSAVALIGGAYVLLFLADAAFALHLRQLRSSSLRAGSGYPYPCGTHYHMTSTGERIPVMVR